MNAKIEEERSGLDTLKLLLAVMIIIGSIYAFYLYEEFSILYRVLGMLAMVGMAVAVTMQTSMGRGVWSFATSSRTEVRKVVWPTRRETTQTTLMVFVMVLIMGIALWLVDMGLMAVVKSVTGA